LLISLPAGGASSVAGGKDPVLRGVTGGWCRVTVSFRLLPLQPPPLLCGARGGDGARMSFGHPV